MKTVSFPKIKREEILMAFAVVLVIYVAARNWHVPSFRVPSDLIGEWHTTDPNYGDRTFEIDPVSISFTTGDGAISVGFIKDLKEISEGSRILYTIS